VFTAFCDLIGDGTGMSISIASDNLIGNAAAPIDPKLAPLDDNGGPTQTMALRPGSPAIAAGGTALLEDQRGLHRRIGTIGNAADIGAVEYQYDLDVTSVFALGPGPGSFIRYGFTVTNNGPDPVAGATLTVPLPQGIAFQSLGLPGGWTETDPGAGNNGTIVFTDNNIFDSGQSADFSITLQLQDATVGANLTAMAVVAPDQKDTNESNDSASLTITNAQQGQAFHDVTLFHFDADNDPNAPASAFQATVVWDNDGTTNSSDDGSGAVSIVTDPSGGFDVLGSHTYAEQGRYGIAVTVTGLDGTVAHSGSAIDFNGSLSVIPQRLFVVYDAPLTDGALTPPPHAAIDQPVQNAALFHFTDADPNGTASDYTATVMWGDGTTGNSGDGTGNVSVVANPSGGFDVLGSHTYAQIVLNGTFAVEVDGGSGAGSASGESSLQVLYPDQPLTAGDLFIPSVSTEGDSISDQVLFHFSDADADSEASDFLADVSWGDGTYSSSDDGSASVQVVAGSSGGFDVVGSHIYRDGSFHFAVRVTDLGNPRSAQPDNGGQVTGASSPEPLNIIDPPVVPAAGPTFAASENALSEVQTIATFIDPGGPEPNDTEPELIPTPYTAIVEWGDGARTASSLTGHADYDADGQLVSADNVPGVVLGSDGETFSINLAHQYVEEGTYDITTTILHGGVYTSPVTTTAMVADPPVEVTAGPAFSATERITSDVQTVATFTDPAGPENDGQADTYMATVDWGDGANSVATLANGGIVLESDGETFSVKLAHKYADEGTFTVTTTLDHEGVPSPPVTTTATVADNDHLTATPGGPITSTYGASLAGETLATFTDTDTSAPASNFVITIDWGDGQSSDGTVSGGNGSFAVMGDHAYAGVGDYTVDVTIRDDGGTAMAEASTTVTIEPETPTVSVADAGGNYNGNPFPASGTALGVDGTDVNGAFSYTYYVGADTSGTSLGAAAPADVGTYTVVAAFTSSDPNYTDGSAQTTFTIAPAATAVTISSSANPSVFGQPVVFTALVTSGSGAVPTGSVQFIVDGSNFGAPVLLDAGGQATSAADTFLSGLDHAIEVVYTNSDGNFVGSDGTLTQMVQAVGLGSDPLNPDATDLFVGGTASDGHITVKLDHGMVRVRIGNQNSDVSVPPSELNALVVYAQADNEHIVVDRNLTLPTFLFGGDGDNVHIRGGGGPTVVVGGAGRNNHLVSGSGRSILIAGAGGGHLVGSRAGSILIGGTTDYDHNLAALEAILQEWARTDESYLQRVANLENAPVSIGSQTVNPDGSYTAGFYLTPSTVHDNGVRDYLNGHAAHDNGIAARDWFFAQLGGSEQDKMSRRRKDEILTEIW
jgi:uncharacterized repeat protein (TIGR01451 family)